MADEHGTTEDRRILTQKELVSLIEGIHEKISEGLGNIIVLEAAFSNGFEMEDIHTGQFTIRDLLTETAGAIKEAHNLTHTVEW